MCSYDFHIRLWNCPDDVEFFFIIICRLINYMPILTVRPLIDNKVYLMTTAAYFFFSVHHDFHVRCCSYLLTLTRGVSHVAQELLTLPEHLSSPPVFCEVHLTRSLVFYVMFCRSLFVLLHSFFLLVMLLSLFCFTASYCHYDTCITLQVHSSLSYVTLQWNIEIWSYKTCGH
jgi:hypothetical protein